MKIKKNSFLIFIFISELIMEIQQVKYFILIQSSTHVVWPHYKIFFEEQKSFEFVPFWHGAVRQWRICYSITLLGDWWRLWKLTNAWILHFCFVRAKNMFLEHVCTFRDRKFCSNYGKWNILYGESEKRVLFSIFLFFSHFCPKNKENKFVFFVRN